jgi:hypothetical protein
VVYVTIYHEPYDTLAATALDAAAVRAQGRSRTLSADTDKVEFDRLVEVLKKVVASKKTFEGADLRWVADFVDRTGHVQHTIALSGSDGACVGRFGAIDGEDAAFDSQLVRWFEAAYWGSRPGGKESISAWLWRAVMCP